MSEFTKDAGLVAESSDIHAFSVSGVCLGNARKTTLRDVFLKLDASGLDGWPAADLGVSIPTINDLIESGFVEVCKWFMVNPTTSGAEKVRLTRLGFRVATFLIKTNDSEVQQ